ncbi:thiamine pyrophosphokinase [Bacteroidia bacterium]|nr:thiamine pyrophosphokinase [Bacteroidia bacterium]
MCSKAEFKNNITPYNSIIIANGSFPRSALALGLLKKASAIIACDGAVEQLCRHGFEPTAIVGDLDSISDSLRLRYADRLHGESEQETNDLTKAVRYACAAGYEEALILGATGLREDHTLGNISLLLDYARQIHRVEMLTDYGLFTPILHTTTFASTQGQQVSIFTPRTDVEVRTEGLRWPINGRCLTAWWQGSLNETVGSSFTIFLTDRGNGGGGAIIYRLFSNEPKE